VTGNQADVLAEGLDVVFCGINPAATAVAAGHNFSHRNNRFWAVLCLAGFTDRQLRPDDEHQLLRFGCGITAVVARPTRRASQIRAQEFRQARAGVEAKIRRWQPQTVAFLGKRALAAMTGTSGIEWGPQPTGFGGTDAWVLPNPSGLNRGFTRDALVCAYTQLRLAVAGPRASSPAHRHRQVDKPQASTSETSARYALTSSTHQDGLVKEYDYETS
jgi:TDG/mug DNA glycosylase family protein